MRYIVQFVLPIIILCSLVYLVSRGRYSGQDPSDTDRDQRTFLMIFSIGAALAAVLGYLLYQALVP